MTDDISTVEYDGAPEPGVCFEPVGTEPRITYTVDWENRPRHDPKCIKKLHTAQVKLAIAGSGWLADDFPEEYDAAMSALNDLVAAVTDHYIDDRESPEWYNLYMGNLDELPGVTKHVEREPAGGHDE